MFQLEQRGLLHLGEIGPVECWRLQERIEAEECLRVFAFTIALTDSSYAQRDSVMESGIKDNGFNGMFYL